MLQESQSAIAPDGAKVRAKSNGALSTIVETARGPIEYAEEGGGPVVLAMHGTPGGYDQISALSGEVSAAGFRIVGWSRPGYLRTPITVGRTIAEQADAGAHLLDAIGHQRAAVYGASGGGPAAIQFVLRHPDRVWALILECAISGRFVVPRATVVSYWLLYHNAILGLQRRLIKSGRHSAIKMFVAGNGTLDPKAVQRMAEAVAADPERLRILDRLVAAMMPPRHRRAGTKNDMRQFGAIEPMALEGIKCPALVIHGTADADVPFSHGERAARSIPGAEFYPVQGGVHLLWITGEARQICDRKIAFLRQHAPA
ncbi:MAG: alpha/beta fold hydrolase [Candidatus Binataceae bacterium]